MKVKMDVQIKMKLGGHRSSQMRDILIKLLSNSENPLSVPDIQDYLEEKNISFNKTTIYREIEKLMHHQIIRTIYLDAEKARYELADGRHHHHIMCRSCKRVDELPLDDELDKQAKKISKKLKYTNINHSLEFFGVCKNCI